MRRKIFLFLICMFAIIGFAIAQNQDSLTITTYYPAPYGVYKNLRIYPSTAAPTAGLGQGLIYFDSSSGHDHLRYYNNTGWVEITDRSCTLVTFASSGTTNCPNGFYTWAGLAQPSGEMLCCKVDNRP